MDVVGVRHYWPPNLLTRESEAASFSCQSIHKACQRRWRLGQILTAGFITAPCLGSLLEAMLQQRITDTTPKPAPNQQPVSLPLFSSQNIEKLPFGQLPLLLPLAVSQSCVPVCMRGLLVGGTGGISANSRHLGSVSAVYDRGLY